MSNEIIKVYLDNHKKDIDIMIDTIIHHTKCDLDESIGAVFDIVCQQIYAYLYEVAPRYMDSFKGETDSLDIFIFEYAFEERIK